MNESNDALDELSDATEAITDSISIATGDLATKFEPHQLSSGIASLSASTYR